MNQISKLLWKFGKQLQSMGANIHAKMWESLKNFEVNFGRFHPSHSLLKCSKYQSKNSRYCQSMKGIGVSWTHSFKYIIFNQIGLISWNLRQNCCILIKISLKFVPQGAINNVPALVQIMAWHWPGNRPLSEPMMIILLTYMHHSASMS